MLTAEQATIADLDCAATIYFNVNVGTRERATEHDPVPCAVDYHVSGEVA